MTGYRVLLAVFAVSTTTMVSKAQQIVHGIWTPTRCRSLELTMT